MARISQDPDATSSSYDRETCAACGMRLESGDLFCSHCGVARPHAPRGETLSPGAAITGNLAGSEVPLVWSRRIPLINNRFILWDYFRALATTFGIVVLVVFGLVAFTEDVRLRDLQGMEIILPIVFAFFVLVSLIAALVLGNHFNATFTLDEQGLTLETGGRERTIGRIGLVLGILSGKPGLAGAGLIATSREVERHSWDEVRKVRVYPGPRVVCLSDSWHCFMRLYCTPELFEDVVRRVKARAPRASVG